MEQQEAHWERAYEQRSSQEVSWFEAVPQLSLRMIEAADLPRDAPILDVGGGASRLAGELVGKGFTDVTVTDLSAAALSTAKAELGAPAEQITWIQGDIRRQRFERRFALWHDRAVLHFMVEDADREAYLATLMRSLLPDGHVILATFGPEGPERCSGLPVRRYAADELASLLGAELALLSTEIVDHRTPRGTPQQFLYAHFARAGGG